MVNIIGNTFHPFFSYRCAEMNKSRQPFQTDGVRDAIAKVVYRGRESKQVEVEERYEQPCTLSLALASIEPSEDPGHTRDLSHQIGNHEAERKPNQRCHAEFQQLLRMEPTQRYGKEHDEWGMNKVDGIGVA